MERPILLDPGIRMAYCAGPRGKITHVQERVGMADSPSLQTRRGRCFVCGTRYVSPNVRIHLTETS